jgi:pilus assembly protein CpaB
MKPRGLILLGVSLLLGFAAVTWVKKPTSSAGMTSVVVAKTALNFGDPLRATSLSTVEMPQSAVPKGAFTQIVDVTADDRVVLRAMEPGEPVLASKISGKNGRATLSTIIEKNMRAATVRVDDVNGVAGFIQPSDRVDVIYTNKDSKQVSTLLQNVKVLGIDQTVEEKNDQPKVVKAVTLEVTPEDNEKLVLAGKNGSLTLALRNYANPEPAPVTPLSVTDLVPTPVGTSEAVPPAKRTHKIEMLRGTKGTSVEVDAPAEPKHDGAVTPQHAAAASPTQKRSVAQD